MPKKLVSLFLAGWMALSLVGAAAESAAVTVTDMMGREITLDKPAARIVALTASDCEILCALGGQDMLAGRGAYCDYPESIANVPVVDSGAETNVEQIIALEPQVVLMSSMAQSLQQVEALEKAGVRVAVSDAQDIQGVYAAIRLIGALANKAAEADAMVTDMQTAFKAIAAQSRNTGKTVYFEVSPLEWGLWTAGKGTFMDELATLCGLTNAFGDVDGWAEISEEQVLERDPDYIVTITMYGGEGPSPVEEIKCRHGWEHLSAIENDNIFNADSNEISRPGPRLKDAAEALYRFVNDETAAEPAA